MKLIRNGFINIINLCNIALYSYINFNNNKNIKKLIAINIIVTYKFLSIYLNIYSLFKVIFFIMERL